MFDSRVYERVTTSTFSSCSCQFLLRRILWLRSPKIAILDSYSASNLLYFGTSFVVPSQLSTLFVILVNSLGVVT